MKNKVPEPLDPILVINAYAQGILPMADHLGKIRWFAPDTRAILEHENLYGSRSLRAKLRKRIYVVHNDIDLESVIRLCYDRDVVGIHDSVHVRYLRYV